MAAPLIGRLDGLDGRDAFAAIAILIVAIAGEALADGQLGPVFKKTNYPQGRGLPPGSVGLVAAPQLSVRIRRLAGLAGDGAWSSVIRSPGSLWLRRSPCTACFAS